MSTAKGMAALPRNLITMLVTVAVLLVVLTVINQPLQNTSAPQGIVSFQLAGTADHARNILLSWGEEGLVWAKASLWLDFLFIPAYLLALLHLTRHFMKDRPGVRERTIARWVQALFLTAGVSDTAQNILLLNNFHPPGDTLTLYATICALVRYTGLALGIAGLVIIRASRRHPPVHN